MKARFTASALPGLRSALVAALVAGWAQAPLGAQYISPGSVATTLEIESEEILKKKIEGSRWKLGQVRVDPWIGLNDVSFVSNQNDELATKEEDFTAAVGAGVRAYLPTGKAIWAAHALPEYVWWQDDVSKRRFNGRYGLGLFGYFNRLRLELSYRSVEQQAYFSSEIQELTSSRTDTSTLNLEVDVARRLVLYGTGKLKDLTNEEDDNEVFALLDRDDESYTVGLRYRTPRGWTLGLGFEDVTTDFGAEARNLSNSGTNQLAEVGFAGNRIGLRLALAFGELEGAEGSDFGAFDETTGNLEALWKLSPSLGLLTYGRRRQTFSVDQRNSFGLEDRQGARLDFAFSRSTLSLSAEVGEDQYTGVDSGLVDRRDDVTAFGVDLRFDLGELAVLTLQLLDTRYDSDLPEFDRETTDLGFSIELGGLIEKLNLGASNSGW